MRRRRGLSEVVGMAIVTSVIVMIGVGLWYFLFSHATIQGSEKVAFLGGNALLLRSNLGADYVHYPDTIYGQGTGSILLRNVGQEPVVVFRLITIYNGSVVVDTGVAEIARIPVGGFKQLLFSCPSTVCTDTSLVTLQVHYLPEQLFDLEDPRLRSHYSETELYKIASFQAVTPVAGLGNTCTVNTENWILVELVDPKEDSIYGDSTDFIKIRVLNASVVLPSYHLAVTVTDHNNVEASGSVTINGTLPQEVYVRLDKGGLVPPFDVEIYSLDPGFSVYSSSWNLGNSFGNFLDYIKLRIDLTRLTVDEVILSMGFYESGEYELMVEVYDCNGRLATMGSMFINITTGGLAGYFEQYSIVLRPPVSVFNIGRIVFRAVDHTPYVTVTYTLYITSTVTRTTTTTTYTTSTETEVVSTTITTTITRVRPSTTTTTTSTITRTTTTVGSTFTSYITRTTSTTTYTATITRTQTITSTSTSYSPTITQTQTSTSTSYTTTRTTVTTSTTWRTATTTTTTTTTTTITGGGGAMQYFLASDRGPSYSLWWIYYVVAASILPAPLSRLVRWWNR